MNVKFSKASQKKVDEILSRYPEKRAAMLPVLYLAEKEFGYISPEVEVYVGELLDVPPVKVHEVMTFYTLIARQPRGKLHFQVCRGLSCDLRGCERIMNYLSDKLGVRPNETSEDLKVTLTPVECLGACETAPMMQLNEDYIGHLTAEKIDEILKGAK
ncbi:MAG: NAD(P)H-dependent oxidoreductase subunit E [Calditrichaeota bacterium]|nr:MAG: NAD(P)H-dependent oxidoreductase subunit E [Calditrichota bacterium]